MWMVDDENNGKEVRMPITDDPTFGRKLRPLMPRPSGNTTPARGTIPYTTMLTRPLFCTQNPNTILPLWNQYPTGGVIGDYGVKREMDGVPLVSTRWNPTPEQLQALEEMYKRGTRTPTAQQIQQIAARLRRFGKIEGKNVFYWFQNHKARERQKKRRQLELLAGKEARHAEASVAKQTGLSRRHHEIEHNKELQIPSNWSTPSEDCVSMHASVTAERKKLGMWTQVAHKELQSANNEITSWKLDLDSSYSYNNNSLKASSSGQENTKPSFTSDLVLKENRTLELFPMGGQEENRDSIGLCLGNKWRPNEFIEFLPIINK